MSKPIQDLRYGLQTMLKKPCFMLIAVFTLALGVGANKPNLAQADKVDDYIPSSAITQLSNKDRVEMFEEIWRTINDSYGDPTFGGIDWGVVRERYRPRIEMANDDREFSVVLEEMVAELNDSHTSLSTPYRPDRKFSAWNVGFRVNEIETTTRRCVGRGSENPRIFANAAGRKKLRALM